jgi:Zn-dependent protease with chaperone function
MLLVVYYLLAVILIIGAIYLALAGLVFVGQQQGVVKGQVAGREYKQSVAPPSLWIPDLFLAVVAGGGVIVACGTMWKIFELSGGGESVAETLGGKQVPANTTDLSERILLNVVEEMALASGTPVPPVYLIEEAAINAFAAGTTPQNAVIGITRGALDSLKRDELQGVIAHEFSHILNGDMRLNIRLIGILNGILLIALLGYFLMRLSGESSSRSSRSDKKGGAAWLIVVGVILYVIGYIGVFFSHLIKSAVSRQREFLADASAVQFTRNPSGISGALQRIGGLAERGRIRSSHAEEVSHLFFANGVRESFLGWLATHPPLITRILRIDPHFNGEFTATRPVTHVLDELRNPQQFAKMVQGGKGVADVALSTTSESEAVHASAVLGAKELPSHPTTAVAQIGEPIEQHVDYARELLEALPDSVAEDIRTPLGAVAIVHGLLLHRIDDEIRREQVRYLNERCDQRVLGELKRIYPQLSRLPVEMKLPLISLAVPALQELSPQQLSAFRGDVNWLIKLDQKVSLFEFGVYRMVLKRLLPRLEKKQGKLDRYRSWSAIEGPFNQVLSAIIHLGQHQGSAEAALSQARQQVTEPKRLRLLSRSEVGLTLLDRALDELVLATHPLKKQVLSASAACICADQQVTVEEAELLRILADALECPMPPILKSPINQA